MMKTMLEAYRNIPRRLLSLLGDAASLCPFVIRAYARDGKAEDRERLMLVSSVEGGDAWGWYLADVSDRRVPLDALARIARENAALRAELNGDEADLFDQYARRMSLGKFPFGKYRGMSVEDVMIRDLDYVRWAAKNSPDFISQISDRVIL